MGFGGFIGGREFGIEAGNFGLCDLEVFGGGAGLSELLTKRGDLHCESWGAVSGGGRLIGEGGLKLVALLDDGGELFAGVAEFRVEFGDFVLGDLKVVGRGGGLGELLPKSCHFCFEGWGAVGGGGRLISEKGLELVALLGDGGELFAGGGEFGIEPRNLVLGDWGSIGRGSGWGEIGAQGLVLVGAGRELSAELGDFGFESGSAGVGRVGLAGEDGLELIALLFDCGEFFASGDELLLGDGGAVFVAVGGEAGFGKIGASGGEFGGNGSGLGFALDQGLLELGAALMGSGEIGFELSDLLV